MTLKTTLEQLTKAEKLSSLLAEYERNWLHDACQAHTLLAELDSLRELCRHYFKTPEATPDDPHRESCAKCGRNLRDEIHVRSGQRPGKLGLG